MSTFGLIIQGPLISTGKDGAHAYHARGSQATNFNVIFDCRDNIKSIIDTYGHLFNSIVISTWENEILPDDNFENAIIQTTPDPGSYSVKNNGKENNKYRQFISVDMGIKKLKELEQVDYVIKVRTDQFLDLKLLLETFSKYSKKKKQRMIGVPIIHKDRFYIHDFYLIGSLVNIENFTVAMLTGRQFEIMESVHNELTLKYAYYFFFNEIKLPDFSYFPRMRVGMYKDTAAIFHYMFENYIYDLGEDIFHTVVWRGSSLSSEYLSFQDQEKKVS